MRKYAGAEWLDSNWLKRSHWRAGQAMSALGVEVANILGQVWAGLYHLDERALERADWSDPYWISVIIRHQDFATWDFNHLTQLVVLCHDRMIRMSIEGCGPRATRLSFWQRKSRTGGTATRIPTMEDHLQMIRNAHGDVLPVMDDSI